jgi:hypothetical protein
MKMIQLKPICIQPTYIQFNWNFNEKNNNVESKRNEYSIQFKNLNSNQIQLSCIQLRLHYANSFNIKLFKWNLIDTK